MIGDQSDVLGRIKALLPFRWFPDSTPVLDALLSGVAWSLSFAYSLIQYSKLQTRIATATDGFLDLISYDFFGTALARRTQEMDAPYRTRIQIALLQQKATRQGMINALTALTGRAPVIFEPARPADTGAWGASISGWSSGAGGWGSLLHRAQVFITAFRPATAGIPNVIGWGGTAGGWSTPGQFKWSNLSQIEGSVTDEDIYALIAVTKPAGVRAWVRISN
jgi:hypothetical protein